MNQFTLFVIILVVFTYYGGSNVPKVLKDNKELLLGVVVGLVLCSFMGTRLEGLCVPTAATIALADRDNRDLATLCPDNATAAECQQQYCNYTDDAAAAAADLVSDANAAIALAQADTAAVADAEAIVGCCWDEMETACADQGHGSGRDDTNRPEEAPCSGCVSRNDRVRAACGDDAVHAAEKRAFCRRD